MCSGSGGSVGGVVGGWIRYKQYFYVLLYRLYKQGPAFPLADATALG